MQRSIGLHGVAALILLLFAASFVLFVWGLIVLFTGGYVATLDIAANLIASAALVLGIAVLARLGEQALAQLSGGTGAGAGARGAGFFKRVSVRAAPERERETPAAAPASPPAAAPAPVPAAKSEGDPSQTVIREGVVEGRHFRLYADGSIDAEGPNGMRRYRSVDDLRADMLASSQDSAPEETTSEPEQREAAPEEAREPTARSPFAPRPAAEPHPEPHPELRERPGFGSGGRRESSTETGLGGVRPSERLSPTRETPSRSSWSDRFRSTSLFDKDETGEGGSGEKDGDKPRR